MLPRRDTDAALMQAQLLVCAALTLSIALVLAVVVRLAARMWGL